MTDGRGMVNFVDGEGVVGEQPRLKPGQSHDYVSGCPLTTPHGSMDGHYTFYREDGSPLEVRIPFFPLAAPATTPNRSEEHTSELQSLMRISYAVFCLQTKKHTNINPHP